MDRDTRHDEQYPFGTVQFDDLGDGADGAPNPTLSGVQVAPGWVEIGWVDCGQERLRDGMDRDQFDGLAGRALHHGMRLVECYLYGPFDAVGLYCREEALPAVLAMCDEEE